MDVTDFLHIPDNELEFTFARSGGPGGQNVNKVASKAVLRWNIQKNTTIPQAVKDRFCATYGNRITGDGEVVIMSDEYRDQPRNMESCREKLAGMLRAVAKPPKVRRATKPTKASKERRIASKKKTSEVKAGRRQRFD